MTSKAVSRMVLKVSGSARKLKEPCWQRIGVNESVSVVEVMAKLSRAMDSQLVGLWFGSTPFIVQRIFQDGASAAGEHSLMSVQTSSPSQSESVEHALLLVRGIQAEVSDASASGSSRPIGADMNDRMRGLLNLSVCGPMLISTM